MQSRLESDINLKSELLNSEMFRKDLIQLLSEQPRSVSSLARELGLKRGDVEDDLRHAIRSARAASHRVAILPAQVPRLRLHVQRG